MLRQFIGLCAAAALLAMSGAAHALKIGTTAFADRAAIEADTAATSLTYAAETLLSSAVTEVKGDSTTYYNVGGTGDLHLGAPADVGANAGDAYIVAVTLDGMVFREDVAAADLTGGAFTVATGGKAKDKSVVFRLSPTGTINATTGYLNLAAQVAVSSGGGSATLTMTNQTLAGLNIDGVSGTAMHGGKVVRVAPALKETPDANNLTASVESSFKKFEDGMTIGHLGSITVTVETTHRSASSDTSDAVANLDDIMVTALDGTTPQSTISFMGDFSFTEKVYVHGDDDCGAPLADTPTASGGTDTSLATADTTADIRMMEGEGDDAVVTGTTKVVNLAPTAATVTVTHHLCIMVQGDDVTGDDPMPAPRIPDTDAYTVMGSYEGLDDAGIGPMPMERMLGEINRDGTTVQIPYMTTYEGYNQRIVMSNRSNADARYEITFRPEADVTAMAKAAAEGMLKANSTVTMSSTDLVELSGGTRTAATVVVEANSTSIDVTSVTVNRETRDTDTVVHDSM